MTELRKKIIKKLKKAKRIHDEWAEYQKCMRVLGQKQHPYVGGEKWHRGWSRLYILAIKELQKET